MDKNQSLAAILTKPKVRVKKISAVAKPLVESAEWDEFEFGAPTPKSLPVDYEIEGYLAAPIVEGQSLEVVRTKRNGIETPGLFTTSYVVSAKEIEGDDEDTSVLELRTENSIYIIEVIQ